MVADEVGNGAVCELIANSALVFSASGALIFVVSSSRLGCVSPTFVHFLEPSGF